MPYKPHYIKQRMQALSRCLQNASASNAHHKASSPLSRLTAMAKGAVHIMLPIAALLKLQNQTALECEPKLQKQ